MEKEEPTLSSTITNSNFSNMDCKVCPHCEAKWLDGQLFWSTGKPASEADLAGLVCNNYGDSRCINPKRGDESGDTWEKRLEEINRLLDQSLDGNKE